MSDTQPRKYEGQGGLPIKRYMTKLYFMEPVPKMCVFSHSFISGWENTKECQFQSETELLRINAENGTALYRKDEGTPCGVGLTLYRLKEASWTAPPPMATPEQLAMEW